MRSKTLRQMVSEKGRARWRPALLFCLLCPALFLTACQPDKPQSATVAPGVLYAADAKAGVQLLDVDLSTASVRPTVVASGFEKRRGNYIGDCKTVREWAEAKGALGGMNAGYFGDTYDQEGRRKQIVGLLAIDGMVAAPATFTASTRYPGQKFLRSAIGFGMDGTPDIAWATGSQVSGFGDQGSGKEGEKSNLSPSPSASPVPDPRNPMPGLLRRHDAPVNPTGSDLWRVRSAVACGPRLFVNGERRITDKEERLVSPGKLARAFVAYDRVDGKPRHLVLGRADAMEFTDVADYLAAYFKEHYGTVPQEAMCMDGGPSAQVVYKDPTTGTLTDAAPTGVLVPTTILLLPR